MLHAHVTSTYSAKAAGSRTRGTQIVQNRRLTYKIVRLAEGEKLGSNLLRVAQSSLAEPNELEGLGEGPRPPRGRLQRPSGGPARSDTAQLRGGSGAAMRPPRTNHTPNKRTGTIRRLHPTLTEPPD